MNLEVEAYEGELKTLRAMSISAGYEIKAAVDEIKKLRELNDLYNKIFIHSFASDKVGNVYFICGEGGEKDSNNLPKQIHVCPAYGVDWFQIYERTDKSFGPEW